MSANRRQHFVKEPFDHGEPIRTFSIIPIIMVVALINMMLLMSVRQPTHALLIDLPYPYAAQPQAATIKLPRHRVKVGSNGAITWNDLSVDQREILSLAKKTLTEPVTPVIIFEPDANASYELSINVLNALSHAGLTQNHFCIEGLSRHRAFGKPAKGGVALPMLTSVHIPADQAPFERPPMPNVDCESQMFHTLE